MSTTFSKSSEQPATGVVRFHLSLNTNDLARSIAFFQILFDTAPARSESDYAKFELNEPPLALSLLPQRAPAGGKLNHLGFRLTSSEALVAMQTRLELHSISTLREEGVECCYSRQTKFWLHDPDGNLWEIYTLEDDLDHRGPGHAAPALPVVEFSSAAPAIWAHRLGEPFPTSVMVTADGVDEVLLQGSFNAALPAHEKQHILGETYRMLKPGGSVALHQLSARTTLASLRERLPGPAAAVEAIPSAEQLIAELEAAGFVDLYFDKLANLPCFVVDGVECRETRLIGFKPCDRHSATLRQVLYKGPFRQIEDDRGQTFRRGQWTTVDEAAWNQLLASPHREQFVFPQACVSSPHAPA